MTNVNINDLWMIICTLLVFVMIPGMGMFYAGMSRSKNSVSTIALSLICLGPCALTWLFIGNSLVFGESYHGLIGHVNLDFLLLQSLSSGEKLTSLFNMTFSILSVAIISGAVVERINIRFWIFFCILWPIFVYYPVAHWVWNKEGWIAQMGAVDFAGGVVVHITTGFSALVFAKILGRRNDFFKLKEKYSVGLSVIGTVFVCIGWLGFNSGSTLAFNDISTLSLLNSLASISAGVTTWLVIDLIFTPHRVSVTGICVSIMCSLVAITPAAGYVSVLNAMIIGAVTVTICNIGIRYFHSIFKIDDSCDVFVSHGVGGFVGALLTGVFATSIINPIITNEADILMANLKASIAVACYAMVMTKIIISIMSKFIPHRVTATTEAEGLDIVEHGERIIQIKN